MPITVEAVRLAMNAVADAKPAERRQRMVELMTIGRQLRERVMALPCPDGDPLLWECPRKELSWHCWLVQENAYLNAIPTRDPAFFAREDEYIRRVELYQEAADVVAAALHTIRDATDGSTPPSKPGIWRQISEPPF